MSQNSSGTRQSAIAGIADEISSAGASSTAHVQTPVVQSDDPTATSFSATADSGNTTVVINTDVQDVAIKQTNLLNVFYDDVVKQSASSFRVALAAAVSGLILFIGGVYLLYTNNKSDAVITVGTIGAVAGAIIEIISSLLFYLYSRTTAQLSNFHNRLLRVQRFLLARKMCDAITDTTARDAALADLIKVVSNAQTDSEVADAPLPKGGV